MTSPEGRATPAVIPAPGLGGRLRAARVAADLSREELGRRIGSTSRTVRRLEDEQRRISDEELGRIAEACGAPVWFLALGWRGGTAAGSVAEEAPKPDARNATPAPSGG